ncbi:MAG TPA: TonB-dependent receptor, partial [Thermoanaerobaculia bacterium]|nr:TonB-dependent receptor [Thermoanaerobaculia bacterium]
MTGKAHHVRRWLAVLGVAAAVFGLLAQPAAAQSAASTLNGRALDESGGPLPGVTITATNTETGFSRLTVTGGDGGYRFAGLPIGTYKVAAELAGFSTVTVEGVQLQVATERSLDITLKPAAVEETITVVDEAPLVSTTPSIGAVISQQELENLPLNGRQFANLAVLAPGTTLGYNTDPTKPGQLVVQLNGGFGRNVNYVVDGGDNTDDTIGGALQNFPLESVQEFKIQTQQYKAEYGRTTGGVLSVVTKTGTNEFKGSAYGFFRDKSLNSETETEKQSGAGKQPYKRKQYGISFGGPIVEDKAHFFATYEKTKRDTAYTINTGGVLPNLDGQSVAVPFEDELGQAKVSWDPSPKQFLQVRYGFQKNTDKYGQGPLTAPSALGTVTNDYKSILVGHTLQLGADALNEAVFQYTKFANSITADSNDPFLYWPSGVTQGQNINTPQTTNQKKYQYKDDLSFSRTIGGKRHDFKAGLAYIDEPTLGGDFTTGTNGQFSLVSDALGLNSPVADITFNGGTSQDVTPVKQYGGFFQDDWSVSSNLTLNLGLRYDYNDGFDLDQRASGLWQTLSTQTRFNEGYLRAFQGGKGGKLKNDTNNWAPRLGFTWDVKGDGKQLLRGGAGRYYDFPYTNATILFPALAVQSATFGAVYNVNNPNGIRNPDGTLFRVGQP